MEMNFGYNEDKTEYNSPYTVSIFHEDTPINWVLASCVLSSQSHLIPAELCDVSSAFQYYTKIAIVCSQRFSCEMFLQLSDLGYQEIYLVSKDNLVDYNRKYYNELSVIQASITDFVSTKQIDFKCVSYEEILDYVKMMGNAYQLYDDYLAIYGNSPDKAKISMKLKFIERGLTADGTPIKDALAKLCGRINYHSLLDIVLAKGRAYFDIAETEANKALEECRILQIGDKSYALIMAISLSEDALINLAPMYEKVAKTSAIIYAMYNFPNSHWRLRCVSNGGSAIDCLRECYSCETISGSFSSAEGETISL